ncbi:MAG: DNA repair protein RecO [Thermoguttaceae bacterium]|nr:DNA repair protein RecO [Thermoguttaceae bacterium]
MSRETADAIVLKTTEFSESSLILDVFTREFGKISGLAKGARRLKNPFETSLDLLASIRLSFIKKDSDALDLFTEAKLRRRFRPTARNYRGLYAGYYIAELLDRTILEDQTYPELWSLADATLERLQFRSSVEARVAYFEAGLLEALGEFPSIRGCVDCGEELPLERVDNLERGVYFDVVAGGVVCSRCRARARRWALVRTTIGALKALDVSRRGAKETLRIARTLDNWRSALESETTGLSTLERLDRENRVRSAFIELDEETLEPYNAFPRASRLAFRKLAEQYVCRTLRLRPRTLDFLPLAFGEREQRGEVPETELASNGADG